MALLLKTSIKKTYAEALLNDIASNRNQYFLFVGKSTQWDATTGASADIVPVIPANTDADEYDTMRGIIGYKKLDPSKIVFALPRNAWSNRVFDAYQDDVDLFSAISPKIFYTTTSTNNIYKCVGAPAVSTTKSTVQPSHTTSTAVKYSDGYTWKYLATVKESLLPYELVDYLPVSFVKTQQDTLGMDNETTLQFNAQRSAIDGELTRVKMVYSDTVLKGASAAVYMGSEYGEKFKAGATGTTASNSSFGVGNLYQISFATTSNKFNLPASDIDKYIGYALRVVDVNGTGVNASDINKYGIIHGVTASSNQYTFSIRGEYDPFSITYTTAAQNIYFDIIPHARISGDGSRATAFVTVGKTGETFWRKITGIDLVNSGSEYSQAKVEIVSPKSDGVSLNTIHPRIKAELSPKGGHASNILKELGVKDVILVTQLDSYDEDIVPVGGSYRKFGIIKNPVLNDGSGIVAGTDSVYYTDLILQYIGSAGWSTVPNFQTAFFPTTGATANLIIGTESNAAFPVVSVKNVTVSNGETRVQVKVRSNQTAPITWADRLTHYEISLSPAKSGFVVGETLVENIPAGVSVGGISYAFGITAEGTITKASSTKLSVNVTRNAFIGGAGREVLGQYSGVTAAVSGVSLAYGELVWVNKGVSLAIEGATAELFKIVSASPAYFDEANVPSYTGLTVLTVTQPSPALTNFSDTTWVAGEFIQQGVSASYSSDYASATVYKWARTDNSNGTLYVTEPFGVFKKTTTAGATFGRLNTSLGAVNLGYAVSAITSPQIDIHSGEIIYINSIQPIQKISNQTDEFRLRVGF
jgi:hypothetical protein